MPEVTEGWITPTKFPRFSPVRVRSRHLATAPAVEVVEHPLLVTFTAHAPAVPRDKLRVLVERHRVTLTALPADPAPADVHAWEPPASGWERVVCSHPALDAAAARVTHRNGVLEVVVPKADPGGGGGVWVVGDDQ